MPMPNTCRVRMWFTRACRSGILRARPCVRRLVISRRNTPDLVQGSRNRTFLSAQRLAPFCSFFASGDSGPVIGSG